MEAMFDYVQTGNQNDCKMHTQNSAFTILGEGPFLFNYLTRLTNKLGRDKAGASPQYFTRAVLIQLHTHFIAQKFFVKFEVQFTP